VRPGGYQNLAPPLRPKGWRRRASLQRELLDGIDAGNVEQRAIQPLSLMSAPSTDQLLAVVRARDEIVELCYPPKAGLIAKQITTPGCSVTNC